MRNAFAASADSGAWTYEGQARDEADLLEVLAADEATRPSFYWEHPARGEAVLGLGTVAQFAFAGARRLSEARAAVERLGREWAPGPMHDPACPPPVLVGGFSFSSAHEPLGMWREFPACSFVLPAELWIRARGRTWRLDVRAATATLANESTVVAQRGAGDPDSGAPQPSRSDAEQLARWSVRVERALARIASGELEKVVLARKTERTLRGRFDSIATLRALRERRPRCFTFRVAPRETVFLGSTPELLVRVENGDVETHALAGTAARGVSEESDRASADALHRSQKNRYEQEVVTRDVLQALAPIAERVHAAAEPRVLSVPEAHHLITPVRARLREPLGALGVAESLHPTPATCGSPRLHAGALIDAEERDRGWYTGGVGWIAPGGDGAFAVALRSAVVDRDRLVAWAGAGIVAGSCPADEFAETELKLRAVLGALGV